MKKLLAMLCLCFTVCAATALVACDKKESPSPSTSSSSVDGGNSSSTVTPVEPVEITGVTFVSAQYTYDGTEKTLTVTGLPDGVTAVYTDNKGTNVGTYNASVVLSGEGYITKTLTAVLTIDKATMTGISLEENGSVDYDGEGHFPTINGTLPLGASQAWYFDETLLSEGVKNVGEYAVRLVISAPNYEDLVLTGTYTVAVNYAKMAQDVIDSFGAVPDPWTFLPESFAISNRTVDSSIVPEEDENKYADFVDISAIPTNYIGKQMNVVYGVLNTCDTALGYVSKVHATLNVVKTAYATFLSSSPDNTELFEGTAGGFAYRLEMQGDYYKISATVSGFAVYIFADTQEEIFGARVQLGEKNVLKYEVSNEGVTIAWNIMDVSSTYIQFVREEGATCGYIYETLGALGYEKTTSSLLYIGETHTTVVGTKGDFVPSANGRNCEVYDNATGKLVGTEVSEVLLSGKAAFDTLWYNLKDVSGITSIKKADTPNGTNADTIYINGDDSDTIHTELVIGLSWKVGSRKFDIEFKEVCAYVYNEAEEKYEEVTFEVPMVFIQEEYAGEFNGDFKQQNGVTVALSVSAGDAAAVNVGYHTLVESYNQIKDKVTQQAIKDYCAQ